MICFPVLTKLRITNYELFPGNPSGSGIDWSFEPGATVVAGINGLGKTTLLMMILRSFTGRYDLTGDGALPTLSVVLPQRPVRLKAVHLSAFRNRVSDGAARARVTLSANVGDSVISITRRLDTLALEDLMIDEEPVELSGTTDEKEVTYQSTLTELIGLASFVDVLLVLHHVILFYENRPGALWDPNAQRHLLRALCLDRGDARRVVELERELQRADSQARNINARMTTTRRRLDEALRQEAGAAGIRAELSAEQEILDAELRESERLESVLQELDEQRKRARLAYERAKIAREEADGAVEQLKYIALQRHFPNMDDTSRLVLSRIMTDGRCMVCNSTAQERQAELEEQLALGCCPICGAEPDVQDDVVSQHEFGQARLVRERELSEQAKREEVTRFEDLETFANKYTETRFLWTNCQETIRRRTETNELLRAKLPDTVTSKEYRDDLRRLQADYDDWNTSRTLRLQELRTLFSERQDAITARSNEVTEEFARFVEVLLVEDARLRQVAVEPRYVEAPGPREDRVEVPAYAAEMRAVGRSTWTRRSDPSEVSESQRELIDLAFRLALVTVFGGASTFAMETPEASLDGIAMERVGKALSDFASRSDNRLMVTSNLTNAGIITALFDETSPDADSQSRLRRVLNLLDVALSNRALSKDRERYDSLLLEAVAGDR